MKKAIALLTCLTLSLSLASCGGSGDEPGQQDPCEMFQQVQFPVNEFFPPNTITTTSSASQCCCR